MTEQPPMEPVEPGEDLGLLPGTPAGGRRRAAKQRRSSCLPILLVVVLFCALVAWFARGAISDVKDMFAGPEDFSGPGSGEVTFVIDPGQTVGSMGAELEDLGVVASGEAFVDAAAKDDRSTKIQAGTYLLKNEMKAADVVAILVDPANVSTETVTVPEGLRVVDIVDLLAKKTDFGKKELNAALRSPDLGLPEYADGNPEGYLFPATYTISPDDTAAGFLKTMVDRWKRAADDAGLDAAAQRLGYTPHELMTIASLVQVEGKTADDMAKIARVILNRVENPGTAGQIGRLQIDASVDYALGRKLTVGLTQAERENTDSPYNTFRVAGLPPGPISAPGDDAITAAMNPPAGDWYYYVTVNLRTGETKFATSYNEFLSYTSELRDYCANESEGAC
ncbi:endolytic transglycosylase MltG [Nocardioides sp. LHD-245]|uniref:endolytic transglycosylase MltG n=1 Tax=Nocardioides sp. LHD-245 TaxID=3051387 RepID=UPI0027DECA54|nr:endolytic transglycosylase MltG [Nocardioides sp. LHD-245]